MLYVLQFKAQCVFPSTNGKKDIFTLNGFGDFSWTLDPDVATMMIVAMVVGLGADNKVL